MGFRITKCCTAVPYILPFEEVTDGSAPELMGRLRLSYIASALGFVHLHGFCGDVRGPGWLWDTYVWGGLFWPSTFGLYGLLHIQLRLLLRRFALCSGLGRFAESFFFVFDLYWGWERTHPVACMGG